MEKDTIYRLHPAFYRAMSDVSYSLDVATVFCGDELTRNELMAANQSIGKLYQDLLDKIKANNESDSKSE